MPQFYDSFPPHLQAWALEQAVFFTASAPTRGRHINLSPKGRPSATLAILDATHAAYLDLTGSGAETIAHIYENGRVTLMFCSFGGQPRILRLFCTGRVVEWDAQPEFDDCIARMGKPKLPGTRSVVLLDIWKVQTSCGYAVPQLRAAGNTPQAYGAVEARDDGAEGGPTTASPPRPCFKERYTLEKYIVSEVKKGTLTDYQVENNARSLDGLLGLRVARKRRGEWVRIGNVRARLWTAFWHPEALMLGMLLGWAAMTVVAMVQRYAEGAVR